MDDNVIHVDLRPIGSDRHPPDDLRALIPPNLRASGPPRDVEATGDEDDDGNGWNSYAVLLLALSSVFGAVGFARLGYNLYSGDEFGVWGRYGFYGFFILDKSMPQLAAMALFSIAAGVWRGRS